MAESEEPVHIPGASDEASKPTKKRKGPDQAPGRSKYPRDYDAAREFFRGHRGDLLRDYAGEYIAIIGTEVVDHDKDFSALAQRVFENGGVRPVFMPRVVVANDRPVRIPSPRVL